RRRAGCTVRPSVSNRTTPVTGVCAAARAGAGKACVSKRAGGGFLGQVIGFSERLDDSRQFLPRLRGERTSGLAASPRGKSGEIHGFFYHGGECSEGEGLAQRIDHGLQPDGFRVFGL